MSRNKILVPATGWKGMQAHWRDDLIAAFAVALVGLPLALGIAIASGMEPMAGIIAGVVGGVVTTFFRGGHIAVNGPAAGLIAVVYAGIQSMEDGSGRGVNYMLAAIIVAGIIQFSLGVFKLGKLANAFPSSVIIGMLASIGLIIISKQMHVALGTQSQAGTSMGGLFDILWQLPNLHPYISIISLLSLLILVFHSKIRYQLIQLIPAPIWVLIIAISLAYGFNFFEPHQVGFLGTSYQIGPELLVKIPDNPLNGLRFPDFSKIGTPAFWISVLSITIIASLETLAISKAIDKLDPYRRISNANKDLIGNGIATIVCGCIGGLPIIPVIARSSVNINNNAKTKWSNFYHGLFILAFVLILAPMIQKVPLAALAAILVYTGYKLASPGVFRLAYRQGVEQLIFIASTVIITLYTDLMYGIFSGVLIVLLVHLVLARLPINAFFKKIFLSGTHLKKISEQEYFLEIKGVSNFLSIIQLNSLLEEVPAAANLIIDLSYARLVDFTVQERLIDFKVRHEDLGGKVTIKGLEELVASSPYPLALKRQGISQREKEN